MMTSEPDLARVNRWDSLLAWLSAKPKHKWHNVKAASQRLSAIDGIGEQWSPVGHARHWATPLIRLGHAEFDPSRKVVLAVPPGLMIRPATNKAILYGHWCPRQLSKLRGLARLRRYVPRSGPTIRVCDLGSGDVSEVSEELGVWGSNDRSKEVLSRLPVLASLKKSLKPFRAASEGHWERFDYRSNTYGRWRGCDDPLSAPGLYRRMQGQRLQVFVDDEIRPFQLQTMDEKNAAKWWIDQPRCDWQFDARRQVLLIPYGSPSVPLLVSRCLTISSARLPVKISFRGRPFWKYQAVGERQVEEASRVMERTLEAKNIEDA